jgi:endonuclease YncB( thermonuclease family)
MTPQPMQTCRILMLAALLAVPGSALAQADTITGAGAANGPDIITVNGQRVILLGIDAPEANEPCFEPAGKMWQCADTAFAVLDQTVKAGPVTCALSGAPDPFGRRSGTCTVGGKDVGDELVKQGLALAYPHDPESKAYLADQAAAKAAKQGIWADGVTFELPWVYRVKHNHTPLK